MVNQANPKTQPGGVHGALRRFKYHSLVGPLFISQLPRSNAPKLSTKKSRKYFNVFNLNIW